MFSNQIHPAVDTTAEEIYSWMAQNYRSHLTPAGHVDAESLAEAATVELGVDRQTADDVAVMIAVEIDN